MSQTHQSLIIGLSLLIVVGCFTELPAGGIPQGCQPYPPSCCVPVLAPCGPAQSRPGPPPVKVAACRPKLVPVTYREEGPVRSVVINAVGLLRATIQLPFKVIEAVIPVNRSKLCVHQRVLELQSLPWESYAVRVLQISSHLSMRGSAGCLRSTGSGCRPAASSGYNSRLRSSTAASISPGA